jgi:hypothetical protein
MVGPLVWKESDPDHKGRGSGWYYFRGKNKKWSKFSQYRDGLLKRGPYVVGGGKYRHTNDYKVYKDAPSYPTNKNKYLHRRTPSVLSRMKRVAKMNRNKY